MSGLTVANMSPALGEQLKLDHISPGVTVLKIARGTPASRLRFHPLDRLISVNGTEISVVGDLKNHLQQDARGWEIVIERAGKRLSLVVGE